MRGVRSLLKRGPVFAVSAVAVLMCAAATAFPDRIDLPDGSQPEGIAAGEGHDLFVGSIPTGAGYRVDARDGSVSVAVPPRDGRAAIGLKADRKNRLFVAGGPTGRAFVYDAATGATLADFALAPAGASTFVNDVTLTPEAAYFTDSMRSVLYVVDTDLGGARELPLPDIPLEPGFNLNGIAAAADGDTLIAVQSGNGKLWRIDPATGAADEIEVAGGPLTQGDGILLHGRTLHVVRNRMNQIAVVELAPDLSAGTVTGVLTSDDFDVPTTIAKRGDSLYAVNARFGTPPAPETDYWITRLSR
ncbi:MAG: superoxide dismutase [Micromonosporaceae bacterium]|nr:superoxide dismutase [Micromonosporaceae bacterium]